MLRAVVLKGTAHFFHQRTEGNIRHKNGDLHHALNQIAEPADAAQKGIQPFGNQGRQVQKQAQSDHQTENGGDAHEHAHEFIAPLGAKPCLEFGILRRVIDAQHIRRLHQCIVAEQHSLHKVDHAAHQGDVQEFIFFPYRNMGVHRGADLSRLIADSQRGTIAAFHHHAFQDRLTAHTAQTA